MSKYVSKNTGFPQILGMQYHLRETFMTVK